MLSEIYLYSEDFILQNHFIWYSKWGDIITSMPLCKIVYICCLTKRTDIWVHHRDIKISQCYNKGFIHNSCEWLIFRCTVTIAYDAAYNAEPFDSPDNGSLIWKVFPCHGIIMVHRFGKYHSLPLRIILDFRGPTPTTYYASSLWQMWLNDDSFHFYRLRSVSLCKSTLQPPVVIKGFLRWYMLGCRIYC